MLKLFQNLEITKNLCQTQNSLHHHFLALAGMTLKNPFFLIQSDDYTGSPCSFLVEKKTQCTSRYADSEMSKSACNQKPCSCTIEDRVL